MFVDDLVLNCRNKRHSDGRFWPGPAWSKRQVWPEFLRRELGRHTLGEVLADAFPVFVKPTMPKQFRGAVYRSAEELGEECRGLLPDTSVFTAEVVGFAAEV